MHLRGNRPPRPIKARRAKPCCCSTCARRVKAAGSAGCCGATCTGACAVPLRPTFSACTGAAAWGVGPSQLACRAPGGVVPCTSPRASPQTRRRRRPLPRSCTRLRARRPSPPLACVPVAPAPGLWPHIMRRAGRSLAPLVQQRSSAAATSPEAELFAAAFQGNEVAARAALEEHHANVECTDTVRCAERHPQRSLWERELTCMSLRSLAKRRCRRRRGAATWRWCSCC